jgi:hypothetical protein
LALLPVPSAWSATVLGKSALAGATENAREGSRVGTQVIAFGDGAVLFGTTATATVQAGRR